MKVQFLIYGFCNKMSYEKQYILKLVLKLRCARSKQKSPPAFLTCVTTYDPFQLKSGLWNIRNCNRSFPISSATLKVSARVVTQFTTSSLAYVINPCPNWHFPSITKFKIPLTEFSVRRVSSSK